MIISIVNALYAILQKVLSDHPELVWAIFAHDPWSTDDDGYPYMCIVDKGATEEVLDTAMNQTLYSFAIRVVDVNKNRAQTVETVRKLTDALLVELRKREHLTLGGVADRVLPLEVVFAWDIWNQTPVRYCEINVDVLTHASI